MSKPSDDQRALVPQPESADQADPNQLDLWSRFLEVEEKRIERDNQRTQVMSRAVEVQAENDRRFDQEFFEQQRRGDAHREKRWASKTKMAWTGIVFGLAVSTAMFWMAFAGDADQRATAVSLLQVLLASVASFGLGYAVRGRSDAKP